MNLNQLSYYVTVAELRSFTKAAEQHFMTQAAITQQIKALEENVGTALIDRNSRPISLTHAGEVFLIEARDILKRMDVGVARARNASLGLMGSLRIGYTKGYELSDMPLKMRQFHRDYPNVVITCYRRDSEELAIGLMNNEYDLIYTWDSTNIRGEDEVDLKTVMISRLLVAMYKDHPLAERSILSRSDLKNEVLIYMSPSSTGNSLGDAPYINMYQKAGFTPNIILSTSDIESVLMMVSAEVGVSILPSHSAGRLPKINNLVFVPLEGADEVEEILAVWKKDNANPALANYLNYYT